MNSYNQIMVLNKRNGSMKDVAKYPAQAQVKARFALAGGAGAKIKWSRTASGTEWSVT